MRSRVSTILPDSGEYEAHSANTTGTCADSSTSCWKFASVTLTLSSGPPAAAPGCPSCASPAGGPDGEVPEGAAGRFSEERSTAPRRLSRLAAAGGTGREAGELMFPTLATPAAAGGNAVRRYLKLAPTRPRVAATSFIGSVDPAGGT